MEEKEIKEKKKMSKTSKQLLVTALALVLLIAGSYAWLTLTISGTKTNILRAGKLSLILDDTTSGGILLEKAVPMSETKGKTTTEYTFTLKNEGATALNYTIYLDDVALEDTEERMADKYVRYRLIKNGAETIDLLTSLTDRALDTGVIEATQTNTYTLQVWIDSAADNAVMNTIFSAKLRVTAEQGNKSNEGTTYTYTNTNIKAAYTYDATSCVTGEEETCSQISLTNTDSDIPAGTIIKYAVNDTEEKYFHVLHDDGETLTLQQRENTVRNIPWYAYSNDNTQGPMTILPALETATSGWTNVNNQTYTMGTTTLYSNAYTGCSTIYGTDVTCSSTTYTLDTRTAKARMITVQEAISLGCQGPATTKTCPNWMNNYLSNSTNFGGTVNDTTTANGAEQNNGYWTMQAHSSHTSDAWYVLYTGSVYNDNDTTLTYLGARAVVVISK